MTESLAAEVIRLWDTLNGERTTTLAHWQECSDLICPDRADYVTHRSPGVKRMTKVFDGTAILANQQLASGLHGLLTSPTLRWFGLKAEDDRTNADPACAAWLDAATNTMYTLFNGARHNFASQSNELYLDLSCIGTAAMAVLENPRIDVLFSTRAMRECCIAENDEDRVDTLARRWRWTARQAIARWGNQAGEKVVRASADKPDTHFWFLHLVRPRKLRNALRSEASHKAFESVYVSMEDKAAISVGGFDEFPYLVPRFSKNSGEVYGRSPGMTALPDIKMLQEMVKVLLMSAQKKVDPPVNVPDDGYLMPINTTPGGRNFYRAGSKDKVEPIETGGDIQLGIDMVNQVRTAVNRAFYTDWLLMPSDPSDPAAAGKGVTATYTLQQRDEKMRLLSPMLARMESEFLGPLIDRTFAILWRRSKALRFGPDSPFTPPPPALSGKRLRVEYVSPIAVAQKSSQLDSISRVVQTALLLAQVDPTTPKVLDPEAILRLVANDLATPSAILRTPQQVADQKQQDAQAAAAQQNQEALANVAGAANDTSMAVRNLAQAGGVAGGNGAVTGQPAAAA